MSSSDKENAAASPVQVRQTNRILSSQAALQETLGHRSNTEHYDPFQPRDKVREVMHQYRQLQQETNGIMSKTILMIECRSEYLKSGNDGIKNTVEQADEIFDRDGCFLLDVG